MLKDSTQWIPAQLEQKCNDGAPENGCDNESRPSFASMSCGRRQSKLTDRTTSPTLVRAAFSHVELALANLGEQVPNFQAEDRRALETMAEWLTMWASEEKAKACELDVPINKEETSSIAIESRSSVANEGRIESLAGRRKLLFPGFDHKEEVDSNSVELRFPTLTPCEEVTIDDATTKPSCASVSVDLSMPAPVLAAITPQSDVTHEPAITFTEENMAEPRPSRASTGTRLSTLSLRHRFYHLFDELDVNKSGFLSHKELRQIFSYMGLPAHLASKVFQAYDITGDGLIDKNEWIRIVEHFEQEKADPEFHDFLQSLVTMHEQFGRVYQPEQRPACLLFHNSTRRMLWDILIMCLLFYIVLTLPLTIAFGEDDLLSIFDRIVDSLFIVDIILNFRTTYINRKKEIVTDGRLIARHYIRSWFFLDFLSCLPIEYIVAGAMPSSAKLLKMGKIGKVFKMLRIGKMLKIMSSSELSQSIEEILWSSHSFAIARWLRLMLQLIVCGHWFACILISIDGGALRDYFIADDPPDAWKKYVAGMYWSMMTMTTVGYGDVAMRSTNERVFAIVAMLVGGSIYGYVIGSMTSLVAQHDLNQRAFKDRMDLVMSWLDFHEELPESLRRRIWRHFKDHLSKRTAIDDKVVMNDLPQGLKHIVMNSLMHDDVRHNPLFENLGVSDLAQLATTLEKISVQPGDPVCEMGELGTGMFIIIQGWAVFEQGSIFGKASELCAGESFGEEVLLQLNTKFCYTIVAKTRLEMFKIDVELFKETFEAAPHVIQRMRENFLDKDLQPKGAIERGRSTLIGGGGFGSGSNGMPPGFPDAVLDALNEIGSRLTKIEDVGVPTTSINMGSYRRRSDRERRPSRVGSQRGASS